MVKSFILSGHFFSPPGLDPWTGLRSDVSLEKAWQTTWKKLLRECYGANSASRVLGAAGRVNSVVNNYSFMSFSFSPPLLEELADQAPNVYRRIREADQESLRRWGHGNALAQVPSSVILPLARRDDIEIQLDWTYLAFRHHFHRDPEGLYLTRQAVSFSVIDALIARGLKFLLLSPWEAHGMMNRGEGSWTDLGSGPAPSDRPFAIDRPGGSLAVFFQHPTLSSGIAGGHYLKDANDLSQIVQSLLKHTEGPLLSCSVDGTWFGYREPLADMCLAALWDHLSLSGEVSLTNYAAALDKFPPKELIKLKRGQDDAGVSAECPHGVERWRSACGCSDAGRPGWQQDWRRGLRRAFERLGEALDSCVDQTLEETLWPTAVEFRNKVGAWRWQGVSLFQEDSSFETEQAGKLLTAAKVICFRQSLLAAELMEGAEPDGPEALDAWMAASKAIDLTHELTVQDLGYGFQQDLSEIPLNNHKTAFEFYLLNVLPQRKDENYVAALFLLDHLMESDFRDPMIVGNFRLLSIDKAKDQIAERVFRYSGTLSFMEDRRSRTWTFTYLFVEDLQEGVSLFLRETNNDEAPQAFDLARLPQGERNQIVGLLSGDLESLLADSTEKLFPLLRKSLVYSKLLRSEPLPVTKALVGLVLNRRIAVEFGSGMEKRGEGLLERLEQDFDFAREFAIQVDTERIKALFSSWLSQIITGSQSFMEDETLFFLDRLMTLLNRYGLTPDSTVAQTLVFERLSGAGMKLASQLDAGAWEMLPSMRNLIRLGDLFQIETKPLQDRVLHLGSRYK